MATPLRESWLESASAWVMSSWGLPLPVAQVVVLDAAGRFVARVDALWPDHGVVGEADGLAKYAMGTTDQDGVGLVARAARDQLVREDRPRDLGLVVVRWSSPDLDVPLVLRDRVTRALDRGDPAHVTAQFRCSCCHAPLTDCVELTRRGGPRSADRKASGWGRGRGRPVR